MTRSYETKLSYELNLFCKTSETVNAVKRQFAKWIKYLSGIILTEDW